MGVRSPSSSAPLVQHETMELDHALESSCFSLLLLPAEIRNIIYRLALTSPLIDALRRLVNANHCSSYVLPRLPLAPALLLVCRQINTEATSIFYAENMFTAHSSLLTSMPYLLHPSRPICVPGLGKRIRRWYVKVRLDTDPRFNEDNVTEAFSGCEKLEVEATEAMFRSAGVDVLLLFKGVRGVGKAKVRGSVTESFARWLETSMMSEFGSDVDDYDMGAYEPWGSGSR